MRFLPAAVIVAVCERMIAARKCGREAPHAIATQREEVLQLFCMRARACSLNMTRSGCPELMSIHEFVDRRPLLAAAVKPALLLRSSSEPGALCLQL